MLATLDAGTFVIRFIDIAIVGVIVGPGIRLIFDRVPRRLDPFGIGYVCGMPFAIGCLAQLATGMKQLPAACFAGWVSLAISLSFLMLLGRHRHFSIAMAMPLFLPSSALGSLAAFEITSNYSEFVWLLAAASIGLAPTLACLESLRSVTHARYWVRSSIDIDAPPEVIWKRIVRVDPIQPHEWSMYRPLTLLGFPVPDRAELTFDGIDGLRQGIFSGQVLFDEPVRAWDFGRYVEFEVQARADAQSQMPFDEFTRIGGRYFDVTRAYYELEPLANGAIRLHLGSMHRVSSRMKSYASLWSRLILWAFQRDVLVLIKRRCEHAAQAARVNALSS